jgi:hypothetical protein
MYIYIDAGVLYVCVYVCVCIEGRQMEDAGVLYVCVCVCVCVCVSNTKLAGCGAKTKSLQRAYFV